MARLLALVLPIAGVLAFTATASAAPPPIGGITQLAGKAGCVTIAGGSAACATARGIDGAANTVVSPDGKDVYLAGYKVTSQEGLAVFSRDPVTGALTQLAGSAGCITADGASAAGPGTCATARGFGVGDGKGLVFSSDGQWAYLVNQRASSSDPASAIVLFRRDASTGALTQIPGSAGCISVDGSSQDGAGTCQTLPTIGRPFGISTSSDDRFVYVTDSGAPARIHVLARDLTTGALSEVQCLAEAPAPTGCAAARLVGDAKSLIISPDGQHAYSADFSHGVSILDRDSASGMLTEKAGTAGCVSDSGDDNTGASTCGVGRVLAGAYAMSISPNGRTLYVAASSDHGVAIFRVGPDGTLTQPAGAAGCLTLTGNDNLGSPTCGVGRGLKYPFGSTISPDGLTLYVIGDNNEADDGVAVFSLDPSTGAVAQLPGPAGCITADGTSNGVAGACTVGGAALTGTYDPTVSPDGSSVYIPGYDGQTLFVYRRESGPTCQPTSLSTAYQTSATVTLSCADPDGDPVTVSIASGAAHGTLAGLEPAAGTVTYSPLAGYSGSDSFTFFASDGTNTSAPATATITVLGAPTITTVLAQQPAITQTRQSHRRWQESKPTKHGLPVGTTFSFRLNERAQVSLTFTQHTSGRRVNGKCVAQTAHNRHRLSCTENRNRGTVRLAGRAGSNSIKFDGRVPGSGTLPPGSYTVAITAAAGTKRSQPQKLNFTVAPPPLGASAATRAG